MDMDFLQSKNVRESEKEREMGADSEAQYVNATTQEGRSSMSISEEDLICAFECAWEKTYGGDKLEAIGQCAQDLKALVLEMPSISLESAIAAFDKIQCAQNSFSGKKKLADKILLGDLKHEWHALFGVLKKHASDTKENIGMWIAKWYTKPKRSKGYTELEEGMPLSQFLSNLVACLDMIPKPTKKKSRKGYQQMEDPPCLWWTERNM